MSAVAANKESITRAAQLLREGQLVAFPTETVYGLGADATNGVAVAGVFAAKGRPQFNPLIVHVPDIAAAECLGVFTPAARRLAQIFWPGPLTLVLERRADSGLSDLVCAGLQTVAVRAPAHDVAQALLRAAGVPIAAPSANRSGHVSSTSADHVVADLGDSVAMVLDAGPCAHGIESTVLDATGQAISILRPGAISYECVERHIDDTPLLPATSEKRRHSPGQLDSHYAPRARVRMDATDVRPGEALLAFGPRPPATPGITVNLSPSGDVTEAAATFFSALRQLDATGATAIAVMPIPHESVGEAINDRLRRATIAREEDAG